MVHRNRATVRSMVRRNRATYQQLVTFITRHSYNIYGDWGYGTPANSGDSGYGTPANSGVVESRAMGACLTTTLGFNYSLTV